MGNHKKKFTKQDIIEEYDQSASCAEEYKKAKWGSRDSMENRFRLAASLIDFDSIKNWLDIGCSTGVFLGLVEINYQPGFYTGIDISKNAINQASRKNFKTKHTFLECDLEKMPFNEGSFDLVTLIGVLQKCGCTPETAIECAAKPLKVGGRIFITTKNLGWVEFKRGVVPEEGHNWFYYDDIAKILQQNSIIIIKSGGFLTRENKIVAMNDSHTFFILGEKVK